MLENLWSELIGVRVAGKNRSEWKTWQEIGRGSGMPCVTVEWLSAIQGDSMKGCKSCLRSLTLYGTLNFSQFWWEQVLV